MTCGLDTMPLVWRLALLRLATDTRGSHRRGFDECDMVLDVRRMNRPRLQWALVGDLTRYASQEHRCSTLDQLLVRCDVKPRTVSSERFEVRSYVFRQGWGGEVSRWCDGRRR